jgi:signal transduction histidine kinase
MTKTHQTSERDEINLPSYPRNGTASRIIVWIADRYGWVIGLLIMMLISFEAYDFSHPQNHWIHIVETIIYLTLPLFIGLLLVSFSQGVRNQNRIIKIMDAKHKLSLELSGYQDWDVLVSQIARLPGTLASASQACLFVSNVITNQFELTAQWSNLGEESKGFCSEEACQECIRDYSGIGLTFRQCKFQSSSRGTFSQTQQYCLPIQDNEMLLGILQFTLEPGRDLTDEQEDILRNIGVDIAVALKAGKDRNVLSELRNSETALAERRSVSHYLHDHLGQSLGFLHLKMDQLLTQKEELSLEKVLVDLEFMRAATAESYAIVRGILETIHPETTQTLINLLTEHARKISRRAAIDIDFKTKGQPVILPDEVEKAIFFAFEESLSNVEKHARATRVDILAEWNLDYFALRISDNGAGFNPQIVNTDQHFGLEILTERLARVNGRIILETMENSGTVVNILVPNTSHGQLGASS